MKVTLIRHYERSEIRHPSLYVLPTVELICFHYSFFS